MIYKNPIRGVFCISLVYIDPNTGRKTFATSQKFSRHFLASVFFHESCPGCLPRAEIFLAILTQTFFGHFGIVQVASKVDIPWKKQKFPFFSLQSFPHFTILKVSHLLQVALIVSNISAWLFRMTSVTKSFNPSLAIREASIAKCQFFSSFDQLIAL